MIFRKTRRRSGPAKILANLLLYAGLAGVSAYVGANIGQYVVAHRQNAAFERSREANRHTGNGTQPDAESPQTIPENGIVGRLRIPRLGVSAIVREGASERTLGIALGHIPGTAFPGQNGNVGVAGHRDRLFRELKDISVNDRVILETSAGTYSYRVEDTHIVKPTDVKVLAPGPQPELTLVTCYPFYYVGPAPNRFIVKARLEDSAAPVATPVQPVPFVHAAHPVGKPSTSRVPFEIAEGHSGMVLNNRVWLGLSSVDRERGRVDGWVWIMPERRTVWLRDYDVRQGLHFTQAGKPISLTIKALARNSASGYLTLGHLDSATPNPSQGE